MDSAPAFESEAQPPLPTTVALVHEWLTEWGGSEDTLREMLHCLPQAQLFATIDFLKPADRVRLGGKQARTTFLQRAPLVATRFWNYLPITGLAVESHDTGSAPAIVSSSHAFAKGVLTRADQLHLSYVYSPMRYAWDLHHEYLRDYRLDRGVKGMLARYLFHRLRMWDRLTANNVDLFVGISRHVQARIWRTYRRPSLLLYPPVATQRFTLETRKQDHYITVSRLVSYKRVDLMLDAFRAMPTRSLIVIGDGPELDRLRQVCPPNVQLMGRLPDEAVQSHLQQARAFLFAAHEDFGISPVEAQACGTPVIAYGVGGSAETVRDLRTRRRPTGLLFDAQTPRALEAAVLQFEAQGHVIDPEDCRAWAEGFDTSQFRSGFSDLMAQAWSAWCADPTAVETRMLAAAAAAQERDAASGAWRDR